MLSSKTYIKDLPMELDSLTVQGQTDLNGIIYFDASHFGTDGNPFSSGNYLMELDTTSNEITANRVVSFGMQYQRHNKYLLSYYEIQPQVVLGQKYGMTWAGIPTQNGGNFVLMNSEKKHIKTIVDNRGLDLHDLLVTDDGNYIYMVTDQRFLYEDHTITCLMECYMFGQSIVEMTPEGEELYKYDLLDYYNRDSFVMDDVFSLQDVKLYDLTHANSIDLYNDTLIVSVRHTNEVIAISRDTGKLLWRTSEMTFVNDDGFSHQHDAHMTDDGTLLLFDNGNGKDTEVSRAVEYRIEDNQIIKVWEYQNGHFQPNRGSARRLPDGSTLINFVTHIEIVKEGRAVLTITLPPYYTSYQADWNE